MLDRTPIPRVADAIGRPVFKVVGAGIAVVVGIGGLIVLMGLTLMLGMSGISASTDGGGGGGSEEAPSALAVREIPPEYLTDYEQAGQRYALDWAILAGIGKVECDHGRDPDPSCTREGAVNSAGAGGPMQFLASTWARYGVAPGGGTPDRWNPRDAIFGAANYLRAAGAPGDYRRAIFAYNHAEWYVDEVESWAAKYRAPSSTLTQPAQPIAGGGAAGSGAGVGGGNYGRVQGESTTPMEFIPGEAPAHPADGHLAWIPEGVCRDRLRHRRDRHRRIDLCRRPDAEDGRAYVRRVRRVRGSAGVLDVPDGVPAGRLGGGGDRGDQLHRQPVGLLRAVRHGLAEGQDRDFSAGLLVIAGFAVVGLVVVLALPHDTKLEKAPAMGHAD